MRAAGSTVFWRACAVAEPLLRVEGLTKRFGGVIASDNIMLEVAPGELHAIIGPNGAGKTTLIGQLGGELAPDALPPRPASVSTAMTFRRCRPMAAAPSVSRARSRSRRCFPISPPSTTW